MTEQATSPSTSSGQARSESERLRRKWPLARSFPRIRRLASIALLATACAEEEQPPPPPPKPPSDAWFALAEKRCWVFKREVPDINEWTIHVDGVDQSVVAGVPVWKTTWSRNGSKEKEEFYEAAPDALLLRRRQIYEPGAGVDRLRDYDPPPALMLVDGAAGDRRDTAPVVKDRLAGETGVTRNESWSVTIFSPRNFTAAGESVAGTRALVASAMSDGSSSESTNFYFVANKGLVAYDPPGASVEMLVLDRVVDNAAVCPPP